MTEEIRFTVIKVPVKRTGMYKLCLKAETKGKKRHSALIKTSVTISLDQWAGTEAEHAPVWIKGEDELTVMQNQQIRDGMKKFRVCYLKLKEMKGVEPHPQEIVDAYNGKEKKVSFKNIFEAIEDHVTSANLSTDTANVYRMGLVASLKAFLKAKYNTDNIYLKEIDVTFIYRFEIYMQKSNSPRGKPYKEGTIREYLFKLKAVLRTAKRLGEISIDIADEHEPVTGKSKKEKVIVEQIKEAIFWKIHPEQLQKIELVKITGSGVKDATKEEANAKDRFSYDLVRVRLLFLLQTWTGLAYIDLEQMADVRKYIGHDLTGKKCILYYRHKTKELAIVPLFPQTEEILKALDYNARPMSSYDTYLRKIRALMQYYGIELSKDETSVTHLGRHLFGSRMLNMGMSMESIRVMMGHASIQETQNTYARVDMLSINADIDRIKLTEQIGTKIAV